MMSNILGLDVGGANIKAAHLDGTAIVYPFALWKAPEELPGALSHVLQQFPDTERLAVTMTGELCDCFATKAEGVEAILDALTSVFPRDNMRVWQTTGQFTSPGEARRQPAETAAANWLALAVYAGRFVREGSAVLIDIGSTTTDVIALENGVPQPQGTTDTERLHTRELLYTGVTRTPVCALLGSAVMAELFATTRDVYLLLGELTEKDDTNTADGRPATKADAHGRMARLLGGDRDTVSREETLRLARQAEAVQRAMLHTALTAARRRVAHRPKVIISGEGEFLARRVLGRETLPKEHVISLSNHLGPGVSAAACAHAVAVLAQEQGSHE